MYKISLAPLHCEGWHGALSIQKSKALHTDGMSRFDNDRNEIQLKPKTSTFLLSHCCNDLCNLFATAI